MSFISHKSPEQENFTLQLDSETPLDVPLLSNDLLQLLKYFDNSRHNLSQTGHQCHLVLHLIDQ